MRADGEQGEEDRRRRARLGRCRPDQVGREVQRDGRRKAEHDQQDDEPDAQQVVAKLLGGDDAPAGVRHAAFEAVLDRRPRLALDRGVDGGQRRSFGPPSGRGPGDRLPLQSGGLTGGARPRSDRYRPARARPAGGRSGAGRARLPRRGCPGGRGLLGRRGGRGHATCPCPRRGTSTDSTDGIALSVVLARSTSAGVGSSSPTSMTAVPSPNWRRELVDGPDPDQPARREDPDPVADGLDLGQQVARQHDREATLVDEPAQQLEDLDHADRVDRRRRLVEDQQVGST